MRYKLLYILFFVTASVTAQHLERSTLGMAGSSQEVRVGDKSYYVSSSIGQQSVIGTIGNENYIMRQGFQQPPVQVFGTTTSGTVLQARVYPNPVDTFVTVVFGTPVTSEIFSILYDIQGKVIQQHSIPPSQSFQIDLSQIAASTYLLKVRVGDEQITTHLIKN